jgi:hypothetical protein
MLMFSLYLKLADLPSAPLLACVGIILWVGPIAFCAFSDTFYLNKKKRTRFGIWLKDHSNSIFFSAWGWFFFWGFLFLLDVFTYDPQAVGNSILENLIMLGVGALGVAILTAIFKRRK